MYDILCYVIYVIYSFIYLFIIVLIYNTKKAKY